MNRIFSVTASDQRKGYDYTNKKFTVEGGSLQLQDADRAGHSSYMCSMNMVELEAS
jgi:hypothetical protein